MFRVSIDPTFQNKNKGHRLSGRWINFGSNILTFLIRNKYSNTVTWFFVPGKNRVSQKPCIMRLVKKQKMRSKFPKKG